jgi:hypothetical protein
VDVNDWYADKKALADSQTGQVCSHDSIGGCVVAGLEHVKALLYYDDRPDTKVYVLYLGKYRIQFDYDIWDEYQDKYASATSVSDVVSWINDRRAPRELLDDVGAFDSMVAGIQFIGA